jgi:hypothetical protein
MLLCNFQYKVNVNLKTKYEQRHISSKYATEYVENNNTNE